MNTLDASGQERSGIAVDRSNGHVVASDPGNEEPDVLILPPAVERELSQTDDSLGTRAAPSIDEARSSSV